MPALGIAAVLVPSRPTVARPDPKGEEPPAYSFVINFAQIWDHKAFAPFREARGKAEFAWVVQGLIGVAPSEIELLSGTSYPRVPNGPVLWVDTRTPVDAAAVARSLAGGKPAEPLGDGRYRATGGEYEYVQQGGPKTLYLVPRGTDRARADKLLRELTTTQRPKKGVFPAFQVTLPRATLESAAGQLPPELKDVKSVMFRAFLRDEDELAADLMFTFPDQAAMDAAKPRLKALLDRLATTADDRAKELAKKQPDNGTPGPLLELFAGALRKATVEVMGGDANTLRSKMTLATPELVSRVIVALPEAAIAGGTIGGNARAINNLKQIGIAWHSYHDVHNFFPANSYAKDGTPLLSWRVHILPYIEQDALYRQFKLDEPWDSPNNKQLADILVQVYSNPARPAPNRNETYFRTFIGPKNVKPDYRPLLLEGESKGPGITSITDGTSNTFMVVEAGTPVVWTKPDDLPYDGIMPVPTLGGPSGQFLALFCDGSVRTANRNRNAEPTLRGHITIAGGEALPPLR
jgi:hypothetical protein